MNLLAGIGINFVFPLVGLILFVMLCRRMQRTGVRSPPCFSCLILFSAFGGWLIVLLTELFWRWSGMASLGVAYLGAVAPFLTAGVAFALRNRRAFSIFHGITFIAAIAYSGLMFTASGIWLGFILHR